ncbi:MAG: hypothetical protein KGM24_01055 [Elusimicrobia bacterium]|nr:hypothetical protein [Elusimicrobiota bacterium]
MSAERGRGNRLGRLTALIVLIVAAATAERLARGGSLCPLGRSCPFLSEPAPAPAPAGSVPSVPPVDRSGR